MKELTAALLIALAASLAFERRVGVEVSLRSWIPLATAAAATVGALSLGAGIWLLPLGAWILLTGRPGLRVRNVVVAAAVLVVLALPAVAEAARFLGDGHLGSWRDEGRLANLLRPLNPLQAFGIWPAGDFRRRPDSYWPTIVLVGLVAVLAAAGLVRSVRSRDALLPYAGCAILGAVVYWGLASPWIEAKSFAIASPALLALAASGCAWIATSGRRVEAVVAAALVTGGVLWSNVLAYGNVNLAPRDQLAELEHVGHDFAGQGPALMTEFQPVGVRHFLRRLDAEGASELRRRLVPLRDGTTLAKLNTRIWTRSSSTPSSSTARSSCGARRSRAGRRRPTSCAGEAGTTRCGSARRRSARSWSTIRSETRHTQALYPTARGFSSLPVAARASRLSFATIPCSSSRSRPPDRWCRSRCRVATATRSGWPARPEITSTCSSTAAGSEAPATT